MIPINIFFPRVVVLQAFQQTLFWSFLSSLGFLSVFWFDAGSHKDPICIVLHEPVTRERCLKPMETRKCLQVCKKNARPATPKSACYDTWKSYSHPACYFFFLCISFFSFIKQTRKQTNPVLASSTTSSMPPN